MSEPSLPPERLKADAWTLAWGLVIVFTGKLAAMLGGVALVGWEGFFLFLLPLLMPLRYLLAAILATVVFFDASLWFQQGTQAVDAIYEAPGAWAKPPELLMAALALRLAISPGLPRTLPSSIKATALAFVGVVLLGGFIGLANGYPLSDVLIYSELRSPIVMVLGLGLLAPLARLNPRFFVDSVGLFLLVHFAISLLSWAAGVSLLWQSYAIGYAGQHAAFFGADESVIVYLLGLAIALAAVFANQPERLSRYSRLFWWLVLAVATFAILASLRRGGVIASAILLMSIVTFYGLRKKSGLAGLLILSVPIGVLIAAQLGLIDALLARFAGAGNVAISNLGHETDITQSLDYAMGHFWFGSGAATRLALERTQAYGIAESLSVHNGVLHVWVRFGVFGALLYTLLFVLPVLRGFRQMADGFPAQRGPSSFHALAISLSGLLIALFLWGVGTPAIFLNFRQAGVWIIATALIYATSRNWAAEPENPLAATGAPR